MSTKPYRTSPPTLTAACALALVLVLSPGPGFGQEPPSADGGTPAAVKRQVPAAAATTLKRDYSESAIALGVVLPEVSVAEKSAPETPVKGALQVGFHRPIPAHFEGDLVPLLAFDALKDGSRAAAFTVTSPRASALRLALVATRMPERAEVRVFGFKYGHQVYGPYAAGDLVRRGQGSAELPEDRPGRTKREVSEEPFWTPVIEGDVVGIEIVLPRGVEARDLELAVVGVSHLVYSVLDPVEKRLSEIGNSGSCNIDAVCHNDERRHTAKIIFTNSGGSWLCSGTMMNDVDGDSWIPFFLTADHCIDTQAEAATVNSYWNFERATCGGPDPTTVTQLTGGGELLANGSTNDFSLLQLNDQIGGTFSGWDTAVVAANTSVVGIHHPSGDLKKWSSGDVTGASAYWSDTHISSGSHLRVIWSDGTTEGGSSGSGLFDGAGRLRGTLHGGKASCSTTGEPDWYGRFDQAFPFMSQWLYYGATALSSGQGRSDSVAQGKWREYKITAPLYAWSLVVELYGLSADADLYVREDTRATITSYDCRPYNSSTTSETCYHDVNGTTTWYVGVRGYSSGTTSFTVRATFY